MHLHNAFSGKSAQAAGARGAALSVDAGWKPIGRSSAVPTLASLPGLVVPMDGMPVSHCDTARLGQFLVLRLHALGDFRNVRDKVRAQPHRIGCASLTLFRGALSKGNGQTNKQQTDR
jgi:hypothetical protein